MRRILFVIIFVLLFTVSAYGYTRITLSECSNLKSNEILRNYIKISPDDTVPSGCVITISYENADVFTQDVIDGKGSPKDVGFKGINSSYQYKGFKGEYKWDGKENFEAAMPKVKTSQVPYHITRKDNRTVEIKLCGIPKEYADRSLKYLNNTDDKPYYYIPLTASVKNGDKEVKIKIEGPVNGFIKTTTLVAANKDSSPDINKEETSTEQTSETAVSVSEQTNKVSVKIGSKTMLVNGQEFILDTVPYIQQASASAMIPLRAVSFALSNGYNGGASDNIVSWDQNSKTAIINYKGHVLEFTANANYLISDGQKITMDNGVYSEITDSRMFVPFRALGEAFGIEVSWDSPTWTASFN